MAAMNELAMPLRRSTRRTRSPIKRSSSCTAASRAKEAVAKRPRSAPAVAPKSGPNKLRRRTAGLRPASAAAQSTRRTLPQAAKRTYDAFSSSEAEGEEPGRSDDCKHCGPRTLPSKCFHVRASTTPEAGPLRQPTAPLQAPLSEQSSGSSSWEGGNYAVGSAPSGYFDQQVGVMYEPAAAAAVVGAAAQRGFDTAKTQQAETPCKWKPAACMCMHVTACDCM